MTTNRFLHNDRMVISLLIASAFAHLISFWLDQTIFSALLWVSVPVHSAIETAGGVIVFFVGAVLLALSKNKTSDSYSYSAPIAAALFSMGLLDCLHAIEDEGQYFIYLHSMSTFIGGLLFCAVLLPKNALKSLNKYLIFISIPVTILLAMPSVLFPHLTLQMSNGTSFTPLAKVLNIAGGVFFFAAATKIYITRHEKNNSDYLVFAPLCMLLGSTAILFETSHLWDFSWWSWHFLRGVAYFIAIFYLIESYLIIQEEERTLRRNLSEEVKIRTIAEKKALTLIEELQKTQKQVIRMEKLSTIGSLVGGVAHEINNPLMGISNYISYARSKIEPGKPREVLDLASIQIGRIDRIVKNLLLFSRNKDRVVEAGVELEPLLNRVIAVLEPQIKSARINVAKDIPSNIPLLSISSDSLEQILVNLLLNAKDVVPQDSSGNIIVSAKVKDTKVEIKVDDNGPGVPDELKFRIFDPFFTTKDPEKGTGLGLSVSADLAERADATLEARDSKNLKGASFVLTLNIIDDQRNGEAKQS